jgi:hypothetical protein
MLHDGRDEIEPRPQEAIPQPIELGQHVIRFRANDRSAS